jgi:uncharacterized protein (TIGR02449 family)
MMWLGSISQGVNMQTSVLTQLELGVDSLLDEVVKLRQENQHLKNKLSQSVAKRVQLEEKNQQLAKQAKQIISQIKEDIA